MPIKERIRARGHLLGFDKIGFAPAELPSEAPRLAGWLDKGYHGTMDWMSRDPERRSLAGRSHPGTQTVICCTLNYYQEPLETDSLKTGIISCYARGEDYHRIMETKLEALARYVEDLCGVETKTYVDTGPLLEKSFAAAAGLGWMGKHSNLISRRGSSWFFLGEILLPLELPRDKLARNHCGSCTRCIEACPTRAIVEPYVIDSRLCISYLTIELKGAIPRALRPLIGRRIYGCDECQEVCPWNRFAYKSEEPSFFPREPLANMTLTEMLQMSKEAFLSATRGSAIRRSRYTGFLRNVAVALGNAGDPRSVDALAEALAHSEPLVRAHVAWALGNLGSSRARSALTERQRIEKDEEVREEIALALEATQKSH